MASPGANRSLDHWSDIRQAAQDEANDCVPCWGECGDTASVADGWYLDNGHGPYCEKCYDRIAEPPEAEDNVADIPGWYDKPGPKQREDAK